MKKRKKSLSGGDDRPDSYWDLKDPLDAILVNISGQARRRMIRDYWAAGDIAALDAELLKDDLDEQVRESLGRIHPFFMGGEYLPDRLFDEVTIVRINLESTTYDVIELRARRAPNGKIALRWVDEYDSPFFQPVQEIDRPFSFDELVEFICQSGLEDSDWKYFPLVYNAANDLSDGYPESLRHFTKFDSDFYPEIYGWCVDEVDAWINREIRRLKRKKKSGGGS